MSLGQFKRKTFLNIKEGRITSASGSYDYVEGYLKGITIKDREFKGEPVKYWYIDIQSATGELYSLALHYTSGVAKSLFNSLASAQNFTDPIRIQTYSSGEYTKVATYLGGEKLDWAYKPTEIPAVEEVTVGDKIVKDDRERMNFFVDIVNNVNKVI